MRIPVKRWGQVKTNKPRGSKEVPGSGKHTGGQKLDEGATALKRGGGRRIRGGVVWQREGPGEWFVSRGALRPEMIGGKEAGEGAPVCGGRVISRCRRVS